MNDKYLVTKANALIRAKYKLTVEEQRIMLTLISLLQPEDKDFQPYLFRIADFMELLGVEDKSKYIKIPKITKGLMKKGLEFVDGNKLVQAPWLAGAEYDKGSGTVELLLSPYLTPYLLGLKSQFTTYPLQEAIRLTGTYSVRIYELLQSFEYKQLAEIKLSELVDMFQIPTAYSDYAQIKRRVLEPARQEINEKTDICFTYEELKSRKKVTALKFIIKPNPKNRKKIESEPQKQLPPAPTEAIPTNQADIEAIKLEFRQRYKGELVDRFVKQMLAEKGLEHVQECLRTYKDYINGRDIKSIERDFFKFVTEGYQKPTPHNGKKDVITAPKQETFRATKEEAHEMKSFYADAEKRREKRSPSQPAQGFQSLKDILTGKLKAKE